MGLFERITIEAAGFLKPTHGRVSKRERPTAASWQTPEHVMGLPPDARIMGGWAISRWKELKEEDEEKER
jgi:hypothetical protein